MTPELPMHETKCVVRDVNTMRSEEREGEAYSVPTRVQITADANDGTQIKWIQHYVPRSLPRVGDIVCVHVHYVAEQTEAKTDDE